MNIPPPGDYRAKTNGRIEIGFASTGALCVTIPCMLSEGDWAGFTCEWLGVLFRKDETPMQNTIDSLKEVFGWDGVDPFWLRNERVGDDNGPAKQFPDVEFTLAQCTNEEFDGKMRFKPGFLNSTARRLSLKPASRAEVLAKYGSRLRALSGGAPAKPMAPTAKPPPPSAPLAPQGPTATADEAWNALLANRPGVSEEDLQKDWYAAIEATGTTQDKLTPVQWGKIKSKFEADNAVPM